MQTLAVKTAPNLGEPNLGEQSVIELHAVLSEISCLSQNVDQLIKKLDTIWNFFSRTSSSELNRPSELREVDCKNAELKYLPIAQQRELVYQALTTDLYDQLELKSSKLQAICAQLEGTEPFGELAQQICKWGNFSEVALRDLSAHINNAREYLAKLPDPNHAERNFEREVFTSHDELSLEQKQHIRIELAKALAADLGKDQVKEIRKLLAQEYKVSTIQVGSVGAYLKITGEKIITEFAPASKLAPKDLCFIYIDIRKNRDSELALLECVKTNLERFSLNPKQLVNLIAQFESRLDFGSELAPTVAAIVDQIENSLGLDLEAQSPATSSNLESADDNILFEQQGGTFANYDNPTKVAWRKSWYEFIDRNVPRSRRAAAKILCLPSIKPEREINGYLELGFLPQNIYAVERDKRVADLFVSRCEGLGVNPIIQELSNVVQTLPRFEIFSLDFLGPISVSIAQILNNLPLAENALVMLNTMGRREAAEIQSFLRHSSELRQHNPVILENWAFVKLLEKKLLERTLDQRFNRQMLKIYQDLGIDLENPEKASETLREKSEELTARLLQVDDLEFVRDIRAALEQRKNYSEDRSMSELREAEVVEFISAVLGATRTDLIKYPQLTSRDLPIKVGCCGQEWREMSTEAREEHIRELEVPLTRLFANLFATWTPSRRYSFPEYTPSNLLQIGTSLMSRVLDSQIVRYESPVSSARTPYQTYQLSLQNPINLRNELAPAYRFIEKIAVELLQYSKLTRMNPPLQFEVSNQPLNKNRVPQFLNSNAGELSGDKWISIIAESPKRVLASIQAKELLDRLEQLHKYYNSCLSEQASAMDPRVVEL